MHWRSLTSVFDTRTIWMTRKSSKTAWTTWRRRVRNTLAKVVSSLRRTWRRPTMMISPTPMKWNSKKSLRRKAKANAPLREQHGTIPLPLSRTQKKLTIIIFIWFAALVRIIPRWMILNTSRTSAESRRHGPGDWVCWNESAWRSKDSTTSMTLPSPRTGLLVADRIQLTGAYLFIYFFSFEIKLIITISVFYSQLRNWGPTEDRDLLVGVYKHGFGCFEHIYDDENLCFKGRRMDDEVYLSSLSLLFIIYYLLLIYLFRSKVMMRLKAARAIWRTNRKTMRTPERIPRRRKGRRKEARTPRERKEEEKRRSTRMRMSWRMEAQRVMTRLLMATRGRPQKKAAMPRPIICGLSSGFSICASNLWWTKSVGCGKPKRNRSSETRRARKEKIRRRPNKICSRKNERKGWVEGTFLSSILLV